MSYQNVQNYKCRCPLIQLGVFGIQESHQIPNIPCDRSLNDVFLSQHLQWYHNFDSVSSRKLVRAIFNDVSANDALFSEHESILKRNISVEGYKCKCPLTHDGVFGLSDEHDVTNVPCGRADKEVLCFQHLQYHHNLSSHAAKKIVLALLSYTPTETQLFHDDDHVTQEKCGVRKLKRKCPLLAPHMYGLNSQHQVPNIPCDRADQDIFLFHHLTYFHKLNSKAATKIIRALLLSKRPSEPLFHHNETIIVMNHHSPHNQHGRSVKKLMNTPAKSNRSNYFMQSNADSYENCSSNFTTHTRSKHSCIYNAPNTQTLSVLMQKNSTEKPDINSIPLDCSLHKQQSYQMPYAYSNINMTSYPNVHSSLSS